MTNKITKLSKLMLIPVLVVSLTACGITASKGDKIGTVKVQSDKQIVKKIKKEQSKHKKNKHINKKVKRSKNKKFNFQGDANHPMVKKSGGRLLYSETEINHAKPGKYKIKHIEYDKVYLKKGEKRSKVGIYSNVTKDEKVYWKREGEIKYKQKLKYEDLLDKITINGKKVKSPFKFADLGGEFAVFDKVDFTKFDRSMNPLYITDKKTGISLRFFTLVKREYLKGEVVAYGFDLLDKKNEKILHVDIDRMKNEIVGFYSELGCTKFDLKINGVGVGNTLNEVYEALGTPCSVSSSDVQYDGSSMGDYLFFDVDDSVMDSFIGNFVNVKNNVVTSVSIRFGGEKID